MAVFEMFVFFKHKTAYDVRISDWSSDVCSSELRKDLNPAGQRSGGAVGHGDTVRRCIFLECRIERDFQPSDRQINGPVDAVGIAGHADGAAILEYKI